jgi:hypothetical protein
MKGGRDIFKCTGYHLIPLGPKSQYGDKGTKRKTNEQKKLVDD